MNSVHRQVTETTCQQHWQGGEGGEKEEVPGTLWVGAGRPKGSLRYESSSKSKSLLTLENKRRVPTEVTWLLFPELFLWVIMSLPLSSPHLWFSSLFFFSWKTKTPLITVDYKWEKAELHIQKKSMGGFSKKIKSFIDFNYVSNYHMNKCTYHSFTWWGLLSLSTPIWSCCGGQGFKYFVMLVHKDLTSKQMIHTWIIVKPAVQIFATVTGRLGATPLYDSGYAHQLYSLIMRCDTLLIYRKQEYVTSKGPWVRLVLHFLRILQSVIVKCNCIVVIKGTRWSRTIRQ